MEKKRAQIIQELKASGEYSSIFDDPEVDRVVKYSTLEERLMRKLLDSQTDIPTYASAIDSLTKLAKLRRDSAKSLSISRCDRLANPTGQNDDVETGGTKVKIRPAYADQVIQESEKDEETNTERSND